MGKENANGTVHEWGAARIVGTAGFATGMPQITSERILRIRTSTYHVDNRNVLRRRCPAKRLLQLNLDRVCIARRPGTFSAVRVEDSKGRTTHENYHVAVASRGPDLAQRMSRDEGRLLR